MKKSSKKPVAVLLCAVAAVLVGLVAYDGVKQSREFSSSSAMMNTAVSADIEGKDAKRAGKEVFACIRFGFAKNLVFPEPEPPITTVNTFRKCFRIL